MSRIEKLVLKLLQGVSDKNFRFHDLIKLLKAFGFEERIRGSHYIFSRRDVEEIINLQPIGKLAKPYQVRQIRDMFLKHGIAREFMMKNRQVDELESPVEDTEDDPK